MTDHRPVDLRPPRGVYPLHDLIHTGLAHALGSDAIAVHQCLWVFAQAHEECRPSVAKVAHLTGMNRHTVSKALDKLVGVGLVTIAKRGLSNIYMLQWAGLRFPPLPPMPVRADGLGPYRAVSEKELLGYVGGDDGSPPKAVYERRTHTYKALDGHRLGSLREVMVCDRLHACGIPHWPGVPYTDLLPSWKGKHTVDFMLAPGVVVEVWCVSHRGYIEVKTRKESALATAGFTLIGVSEQDLKDPGRVIIKDITSAMVREAWTTATDEALAPWLDQMRLDESRSAGIVRQWLQDRPSGTVRVPLTPRTVTPVVVPSTAPVLRESKGPGVQNLNARFEVVEGVYQPVRRPVPTSSMP